MAKITISLRCPKCKYPARAEIKKFFKFVVYRCPKCQSNVVYYDNKTDILSDTMMRSLGKKRKLKNFGNAFFPSAKPVEKKPQIGTGITKDNLVDLKILLETEEDFDEFISKL